MAKDKSEKKDRKEKKEKRSETDGVKKSKKDKKSKLSGDNIAAVVEELQNEEPAEVVLKATVDEDAVKPVGALVPFANPLADEKVTKKVLKSVKKGLSPKLFILEDKTNLFMMQLQRTKRSSAESKK
jgi:H/ACA ribonucleoprotein complex subunit 2